MKLIEGGGGLYSACCIVHVEVEKGFCLYLYKIKLRNPAFFYLFFQVLN